MQQIFFGNKLFSFCTKKFLRPTFRLQVKSAYPSVLCIGVLSVNKIEIVIKRKNFSCFM